MYSKKLRIRHTPRTAGMRGGEGMNRYRCETCNFKGNGMMGDVRCPYDTQRSDDDNCDLLYSYKRTTEEKELMEMCGLTCHSDFIGERDENGDPVFCVCGLTDKQCTEKEGWIKQDARKELLDELGLWLDKYDSYLSNQKNIPKGFFSGYGISFDFRQKLKELHPGS